jgi:hypothetical protein
MPVKQLHRRTSDPEVQSLLTRLVEEWRNPNPQAAQPIILEERDERGGSIHIFVIWDDWGALSNVERSEIVTDAFEQRYGSSAILNLTLAMGLTPVEAERLGIN